MKVDKKHPIEKVIRKHKAEALRGGRRLSRIIPNFCPICGWRRECEKCK